MMSDDCKYRASARVQLGDYVLMHYSRLLTGLERRGWESFVMPKKLEASASWGERLGVPGHRQRKLDQAAEIRTQASADPVLKHIINRGWDHFAMVVALRILRDHGDEIELNLCPRCLSLCRTPRSKQCPTCFHNWHRAS
jgi:hypothetical protein